MTREIDEDRAIRGQRRSHRVDRAIAALADRQDGVADRDQLLKLGLSRDAIDRRVQAGRLHQIHRGVYAVGHSRLSRNGRYQAALRFAGEGAVLSHRSAAALWELRASKEREIDVIASTDRRGDAIVRIHRDSLGARDAMTRNGIRVTKPLRTLLDLAAVVNENQLERAVRQAVYRRLTKTAL